MHTQYTAETVFEAIAGRVFSCLTCATRVPQRMVAFRVCRYVTVLLLSLQIGTAIKYLWTDESTRSYRCDAVHLAYAMQQERMLTPTEAARPMVSEF